MMDVSFNVLIFAVIINIIPKRYAVSLKYLYRGLAISRVQVYRQEGENVCFF